MISEHNVYLLPNFQISADFSSEKTVPFKNTSRKWLYVTRSSNAFAYS